MAPTIDLEMRAAILEFTLVKQRVLETRAPSNSTKPADMDGLAAIRPLRNGVMPAIRPRRAPATL
jgi:hypothetical protein